MRSRDMPGVWDANVQTAQKELGEAAGKAAITALAIDRLGEQLLKEDDTYIRRIGWARSFEAAVPESKGLALKVGNAVLAEAASQLESIDAGPRCEQGLPSGSYADFENLPHHRLERLECVFRIGVNYGVEELKPRAAELWCKTIDKLAAIKPEYAMSRLHQLDSEADELSDGFKAMAAAKTLEIETKHRGDLDHPGPCVLAHGNAERSEFKLSPLGAILEDAVIYRDNETIRKIWGDVEARHHNGGIESTIASIGQEMLSRFDQATNSPVSKYLYGKDVASIAMTAIGCADRIEYLIPKAKGLQDFIADNVLRKLDLRLQDAGLLPNTFEKGVPRWKGDTSIRGKVISSLGKAAEELANFFYDTGKTAAELRSVKLWASAINALAGSSESDADFAGTLARNRADPHCGERSESLITRRAKVLGADLAKRLGKTAQDDTSPAATLTFMPLPAKVGIRTLGQI
jgi:hypothetical protein